MLLRYNNKRLKITRPEDVYFPFDFKLPGDIRVYLEMAVDLNAENIEVFKSHLPGLEEIPENQINDEARKAKNCLQIKYLEGKKANLELSTHGAVTLTSAENGQLSPDFLHIFYAAARKALLKKNLCPVHAACIGLEGDDHVLIVGHAGVGKTSTTLSCATKKNMKVFSGDKTIVDLSGSDNQMVAIAGTQVMTLRNHDIQRWPDLGLQPSGDRYVGKLAEKYQCKDSQIKIKAVILINLNDGADKTKELTPLSALHMLYPYFMDTERADVLIDGAETLFDGTVHPENREAIAKDLAACLRKTPAYHLTGSIEYITHVIAQIAEQKNIVRNGVKV